MSDLVEGLREDAKWGNTYSGEAADRIEQLEAALDEAAFSQTLFDAVVGKCKTRQPIQKRAGCKRRNTP